LAALHDGTSILEKDARHTKAQRRPVTETVKVTAEVTAKPISRKV
jgi:hypothetical protein